MWKFISTSCPARRLQPVGGIFIFMKNYFGMFKFEKKKCGSRLSLRIHMGVERNAVFCQYV